MKHFLEQMEYLPSSLMILRKWFFWVIHKSNIFKALVPKGKTMQYKWKHNVWIKCLWLYEYWGLFLMYVCVFIIALLLSFQKMNSKTALLKGTLGLMATAFLKVFRGSNWFNYFHLDKRNKHFWESTMLVLNPVWILDSRESSLKCRFPEHLKSSSTSLWFWYI